MLSGLKETEEQVLKVVREFAQNEVKPRARQIDEEENVPQDLIDRMRALGLFSIYIPEKYGGAGLGFELLVRVIEEISKACPSTALVLDGALTLFAEPILMFGSEELKKRYLTQVAQGAVGGLAITEPGAGSDAASIRTTAVRKGSSFVVNGTKLFISNGRIAKFFVFDAVTDSGKRHRGGITTFVVDAGTPGLRISRDIRKMGLRGGSSTVELVFEDVEVPEENIVGQLNDGFRVIMETLDAGRIGIAAQALGIAEAAYEEALEYSKNRKQFGQAISEFEGGIQFKLADMATRIEASRLLTYEAARLWAVGQRAIKLASMAKMYASETAMFVAKEAIQIFGGATATPRTLTSRGT